MFINVFCPHPPPHRYSIKRNSRVLIADDTGLGKTLHAIADYRSDWPLHVVYPSSVRLNWAEVGGCMLLSVTFTTSQLFQCRRSVN